MPKTIMSSISFLLFKASLARFGPMRPSAKKTVLAALRVRIHELHHEAKRGGFYQKEMAELLGRAVSTVQSIEIGRAPLTPELAKIVSLKTGVSLKWLLDGDPNAPMTGLVYVEDPFNAGSFDAPSYPPYSLAVFDLAQVPSDIAKQRSALWSELTSQTAVRRFEALSLRARASDNHALLTWKLQAACDQLEREFASEA